MAAAIARRSSGAAAARGLLGRTQGPAAEVRSRAPFWCLFPPARRLRRRRRLMSRARTSARCSLWHLGRKLADALPHQGEEREKSGKRWVTRLAAARCKCRGCSVFSPLALLRGKPDVEVNALRVTASRSLSGAAAAFGAVSWLCAAAQSTSRVASCPAQRARNADRARASAAARKRGG